MRILFLSHYFPPEVNAPASRTYDHCVAWVRAGHEVTVVTCAPNHPKGLLYDGYGNHWFQREIKDGIHVIRVWTYLSPNEGFVRRTSNYLSYLFAVFIGVPRLPEADVVVSTSPQFFAGLAGYFVSRLKRIPWVLEIRDLWPESIAAVGAIKSRAIIRFLERVESYAYRHADCIVPVTDAFQRHMTTRGIGQEKIQVIKNGVNLALFRRTPRSEPLARELGVDGRFVAAYVGTHGMAHHLETILEAAAIVRSPEIVFLLVGDGAERCRLVAKRDAMGLKNVLMLDQLPKERMPALWSIADVSLVLLKKSDTFKTVIPSKIFESLAMEVPVVLGVEGEAQGIVERAGAGVCIEPENAVQLSEAVTHLSVQRDLRDRLGRNGRVFVEEHFDRTLLARDYEKLLLSVGHSRSQSVRSGRQTQSEAKHD
jgi:glycosyltransferase involved in cell wall biosynthesis